MKFLRNIFRRRNAKPTLFQIGEIKAICPYCIVNLPKFPGRKTKCKNCSEFIYVRTRPLDSKRILVKEEELSMVEEQWAIKNNTLEEFQEKRQEVESIRNDLRDSGGFEPSNRDILWSLYNKRSLEYASQGQWGMYRNSQYDMAKLLIQEGQNRAAIRHLCIVIFFDLNGCGNRILIDGEVISPGWDINMAFLADGIIGDFLSILEEEQLTIPETKEIFLQANKPHAVRGFKTPRNVEEAWNELSSRVRPTTEDKAAGN